VIKIQANIDEWYDGKSEKKTIYKFKFIHQNIPYAFNWHQKHHEEIISSNKTREKELDDLKKYFRRIANGNIPNKIFNAKAIPRISQFKIRGLKSAFVASFSKKLIRDGLIDYLDANSKLPIYAQHVYKNFERNNIGKIPGHDPILKNILIKDKNSVAIEIPIWAKRDNSFITGHIDLIQIEKNLVKVIDYKPEGKFLISLPQVATYGLLIASKFNLKTIKCVSFNRKEGWEFDPKILLKEVKEYLINHRIHQRDWEGFVI
jgi:hypothetical protein